MHTHVGSLGSRKKTEGIGSHRSGVGGDVRATLWASVRAARAPDL